jgi:DNA invertase Pin-like site-specific DNA recombinase
MAKIPKEERERLTNEVRELLNNGASGNSIINNLKIGRATFFRYKRRVIKDIIKQNKTQ